MLSIVVDGDMVAYLAAYAGDRPGNRAARMVERWANELDADRVIVAFSDPSHRYFRHDWFPAFKPNRSEPPAGYDAAKTALAFTFRSRTIAGLEADDVMGVLATHPLVQGEVVLVANDRDMLTVPGRHYNPRAASASIVEVSERQADRNHMVATLVGKSGQFPGLRGVGEQRAAKIIWGEPRHWWSQVLTAFRGRGLTEADALLQARLARVLRATDYDFANKRVIPWTPAAAREAVCT